MSFWMLNEFFQLSWTVFLVIERLITDFYVYWGDRAALYRHASIQMDKMGTPYR